EEVTRKQNGEMTDAGMSQAARHRAQAAVILLQLGNDEHIWPLLQRRSDPTERSWVIYLLAALRTPLQVLERRWHKESDLGARSALVLSLGESNLEGLPSGPTPKLIAELLKLYRDHPASGLHGAIDWTLRTRWHREAEVRALD